MTLEPLPAWRRPEVGLPGRRKTRPRYRFRARRRACSNGFTARLRRCRSACSLTREDLREWRRRPGSFFVAALVCILLTILVKSIASTLDADGSGEVVQANDAPAANAGAEKPRTIVEPITWAPAAQPQRRKPLTLEEIAALNAEKTQPRIAAQQPLLPINEEPDPLLELRNQGRNLNQAARAVFADPLPGAWINKRNVWELRASYHLPVDGPEINNVRRKLGKVGNLPIIEQQWWYPRTVELPERHWKGKVAKLRFVTALQPAQFHRLAGQLRVVRLHGLTSQHALVMEAEAFFLSPSALSVAIAIKTKPEWFPERDRSILRGDAGQLPVNGPEIDAVRKTLRRQLPGAIREVKWWPPRLNQQLGHQVSKLRYEVNRNGDVKAEEIVFDYSEKQATPARQPVDLFPERDRRILKLEQARR
jgi:hypothetical protein